MISVPRRSSLLSRFGLVLLVGAGLVAASCTLVGQGHLNVANDLSGLGADNTIFRAFAADPGDAWPPAGNVNIYVHGDDFGSPPSFGMNGYLYLARTNLACPQSEGAPEAFTLADVTLVGIVTVTNGTVNQNVTMQDTTATRQSHFALIEIPELSGYPGLHLIHRCGEITWTGTPPSVTIDPCTLRTSLDGLPLAFGKAFALDAVKKWQFCYGGAAAGSNEKLLFQTTNGGTSWTLISRTTLGSPPAEAGVGELPNGNGVSALFFQDAMKGWLGLSSPGHNLLRSTDGGHNWTEVVVTSLPAAVPVETITFADAMHGTFTTHDDSWTTSDGGATWSKV
jgi:hypothetical protein